MISGKLSGKGTGLVCLAQDGCAEYRPSVRHGGGRADAHPDANACGFLEEKRLCQCSGGFRYDHDRINPEERKRQALYDPPQRPPGYARLGLRRPGLRRRRRLLKNAGRRPMVVELVVCCRFRSEGRVIMRILKAFLADNRGATAIEYGLIAALICGALVSGLGVFTGALQDVFNVINNNMTVN